MRIAFVSDAVYPWHFGGLEVLEHTEASELAKMHDVHFFSMQWPGMKRTFKKEGITYHTHHRVTQKIFYRHGRRSIREAIVFSLSMFRLFKYDFDVLIANEFPILHLPILKLYCILHRCKLIVNVYEVWDTDYWTQYLGKLPGLMANAYADTFLKVADAYITISSTTKSNLSKLGVDSERINILAPTIDDRFISRIGPQSKTKTVIFWGRLIKEKRLDKWLGIVKQLKGRVKGLHGLIIGDGPERENIERLISKLGLDSTVELRHSYSNEQRRVLFETVKKAGLLLQMSEREGLSLIVLESIALGTPVLIPAYSPIPSEVRNMCVIASEIELGDAAAEILNSKDVTGYIKNKNGLRQFYISNVNSFYSALFNRIR